MDPATTETESVEFEQDEQKEVEQDVEREHIDDEPDEEEKENPTGDDSGEEEDEPETKTESDEDDDLVVSIGDEAISEPEEKEAAPAWLKEMRQAHREAVRENRELKKRLKTIENPEPAVKPLRAKPTLEGHDYDAHEYEDDLDKWHAEKRHYDAIKEKQEAEQAQQEKAWQEKLSGYEEAKTKLRQKLPDFDEAEATILENFSKTQQGIVLQGADNASLVIYALGKNSERAKALAKITDPVKFAFAVAKLEKDINVKKRDRSPPPPEKTLNGTGSKQGAVDSTLERLREEAAKTGNYSKVMQYKASKRK